MIHSKGSLISLLPFLLRFIAFETLKLFQRYSNLFHLHCEIGPRNGIIGLRKNIMLHECRQNQEKRIFTNVYLPFRPHRDKINNPFPGIGY